MSESFEELRQKVDNRTWSFKSGCARGQALARVAGSAIVVFEWCDCVFESDLTSTGSLVELGLARQYTPKYRNLKLRSDKLTKHVSYLLHSTLHKAKRQLLSNDTLMTSERPSIINVHTPSSSMALVHSGKIARPFGQIWAHSLL